MSNELDMAVEAVDQKIKSYVDEVGGVSERLKEIEQQVATGYAGGMPSLGGQGKSLTDAVVGDEAYKALLNQDSRSALIKVDSSLFGIEVKNTILGESGSPQASDNVLVQQDRQPGIVGGAFRALNLLDFLPVSGTTSNQIEYTRESSWTNDSAETAEGAQKPESDLTFELVNDPVRTIAHWFKVSRQVLEDAAALRGYIDRRLRHGVQAKLQKQILTGNGTSPNLSGIDQTGRHTVFTPTTGDNQLDSLNRAKYAILANDFSPNVVLLNPSDWGTIERLKRASSDDAYVAAEGNAVQYIRGGMQGMVWGVPVVMSNDVASGKFVMADSGAMQLSMRQSATVEFFEQDDTNVQHNLVTCRGELRAAFSVFTPAAVLYGDLVVG